MENKNQKQNVSKDSTAIQAGRDIIINQGATLEEIKNILLGIFDLNFYKLSESAAVIATKRAEEITEDFLIRLQKENPNGLIIAEDPDFQYSLFTAQKEFARSGDKDLGDLLIDLLIDRSKQDKRNLLQIVLNESLNAAPKLTNDQLNALSLIFIFRYSIDNTIKDHFSLGKYFDKFVLPYISKIDIKDSCYQHLEYTGCGSVSIDEYHLETILCKRYQGLFSNGFEKEFFEKKGISIGYDPKYFTTCINNPQKSQVRFINKDVLEKSFEANKIMIDDQKKILMLFNVGKMSNKEIRNKCIEIRPFMVNLFDIWSNSLIKRFSLTSVGIVIGHANIKRVVGDFANISEWIN